METVLRIHQAFFPLFSGRNCTQELYPITQGQIYRSINGGLIHCDDLRPLKYKTILKGQDQCPPVLDKLQRGAVVHVECLQAFVQRGSKEERSIALIRPPVEGSVRSFTSSHKPLSCQLKDKTIQLEEASQEDWVTYYRPILQMMVLSTSLATQERTGAANWELVLEEV